MNNFTKEYIKECDCKEIQGLRKEELRKGDWYSSLDMVDLNGWDCCKLDNTIWLPTGDQLDEEIAKICDKKNWVYEFAYYITDFRCSIYGGERGKNNKIFWNINPLIAKIKLLKELLK